MKIYQIHEHYGEWDYYFDAIRYTFLNKDKADLKLQELEEKELKLQEHTKMCDKCAYFNEYHKWGVEETLKACPDFHCDEAALYEDDYGVCCKNYYTKWDKSNFYINEIDVID